MSKERLEEITKAYGYGYRNNPNSYPTWLIERVQELETQIENWQKGRYLAVSTIDKERELKERVQELESLEMQSRIEKHKYKEKNKRYREGIKEIKGYITDPHLNEYDLVSFVKEVCEALEESE